MIRNMDNAKIEKKATNIGNDAEKAVLVGLIPLLGLVFVLRLVQWYVLRPQVAGNESINPEVRDRFNKGQFRLWFAVLFWPVLILVLVLYIVLT